MSSLPPLHEDWQSTAQVPQCFWRMFDEQAGCDVIFLIGRHQERMGAHSVILMSRSSVFFKDFSEGIPEKEIFLPEVEQEDFRAFMRFLYTGELGALPYDNEVLMKISEKYNVSELLKLVLNTKLLDMNIEDFCPFVRKYEYHMTGAIKFKCLEYVFKNPKDVFTSEHFPDLPFSFVQDVLQSDYLVLDEETICTGMLLWASKACEERELEVDGENQRKVLGNLLYEIRFPALYQSFFTDNISEKGLLTSIEEVQILKHYLGSSKSASNLQFKGDKRCAPSSPFTYTPEEDHGQVEGAAGGPDVTKGTIRPNESFPILRSLHSGRQGSIKRFTEQSTGWGYRGKKEDAIAFTVNKDIRIDYVFVYGNCKTDGSMDVSVSLKNNYVELSKTTIKVECSINNPYYEIGLENSQGTYGIHVQANTEYHIVLRVKGETGYYGKKGMSSVSSEDVTVNFIKSKYSTNNTTEQIGQIAGFSFTVLSDDENC